MEENELRKLLEKLHQEIEDADTVDDKGRELLQELQSDIRELLERSSRNSDKPASLMSQRLEDSISHLELTHPTLTATLSQLLAVLSNAGI